jgi:hypothetical protein
MAKAKNGQTETPATNTPAAEEEDVAQSLPPTQEEDAPSAAIEKAPPIEMSLAAKLADNNTPLFLQTFADRISTVTAALPDRRTVDRVIDALPDEYADKVASIIRRNMGKRRGLYADDDRPELTELRIFHGTGNDPNRPENIIPGQYYLTSKETVGKQFVGTVLAAYKGRTMWGDRDSGENMRMPVCQSMDRKVGSSFGYCDTCPNKPWRDGKMQRCSDDVVAYMLTKDLNDIVLVRFAKTSEGAGRQLIKFIRRTEQNWSKWYSITADATVNQNDKNQRYYVMKVSPVEGEEKDVYVPDELQAFCDMMSAIIEANIMLPGMAHVYRQAKDLLGPNAMPAPTPARGAGSSPMMGDDTPDYGEMPDAPDTGNTNV